MECTCTNLSEKMERTRSTMQRANTTDFQMLLCNLLLVSSKHVRNYCRYKSNGKLVQTSCSRMRSSCLYCMGTNKPKCYLFVFLDSPQDEQKEHDVNFVAQTARAIPIWLLPLCSLLVSDGIEKKWLSPEPIDAKHFWIHRQKAKRMRIKTVPGSLQEAISKMERGSLVRKVFGEHSFEKVYWEQKVEIDEHRPLCFSMGTWIPILHNY